MKETEKISFYTHLGGAFAAVAGTIYLLIITRGTGYNQLTAAIYGISIITLFVSSSLYHYFKQAEDEVSFWRKLDHFSIFIMIAGSYTPVVYNYLSGYWRYIILLQWLLVAGGFFFKFYYLNAPRYLYTLIYLIMGWVGIIPIKFLLETMPTDSVVYLFLGGLSFTIGAIFYILKKPAGNRGFGFHEIFHCFILFGAFFHYLLILNAVRG